MLEAESKISCALLQQLVKLGVPQKRFCGNAAPIETSAPGPFLLDTGNLLTKLSSANGSHVAGGSSADNNQVVVHMLVLVLVLVLVVLVLVIVVPTLLSYH